MYIQITEDHVTSTYGPHPPKAARNSAQAHQDNPQLRYRLAILIASQDALNVLRVRAAIASALVRVPGAPDHGSTEPRVAGVLVNDGLGVIGREVVVHSVGRPAGGHEPNIQLSALALPQVIVDLVEQHVAAALDLALGRVGVVVELHVDEVELGVLQRVADVRVRVGVAHGRRGDGGGVAAREAAVFVDGVLVVLGAGAALDVHVDAVDGRAAEDVGVAAAEEVPQLVGQVLAVVLALQAVRVAGRRVAPAADGHEDFDAGGLAGFDVRREVVAVGGFAVGDGARAEGGLERLLVAEFVHEADVDVVGRGLVTVGLERGVLVGVCAPVEELHAARGATLLNRSRCAEGAESSSGGDGVFKCCVHFACCVFSFGDR